VKLYPGDALARARVRRLIREAEEHLGVEAIDPITDEFFGKGGAEPDREKLAKATRRLEEELRYFERELEGDFYGGQAVNALDLVLYPWIGGYVKRITFRKPESKLTDLVPPRLAAWCRRIEALPYFDKTVPAHWR
jgi:glutathione S-transferase